MSQGFTSPHCSRKELVQLHAPKSKAKKQVSSNSRCQACAGFCRSRSKRKIGQPLRAWVMTCYDRHASRNVVRCCECREDAATAGQPQLLKRAQLTSRSPPSWTQTEPALTGFGMQQCHGIVPNRAVHGTTTNSLRVSPHVVAICQTCEKWRTDDD